MPDVLVAYFSVSGHTEALAKALAAELGADLQAIQPEVSYAGFLGALRGMWQHFSGRPARLKPTRPTDPYRLVVVGSPVWGGRLAAPVRSYLQAGRGRIAALAGFWVSRSGQAYPALGREMAELCGLQPRATVAFNDPEVVAGRFGPKAAEFAERLKREPAS